MPRFAYGLGSGLSPSGPMRLPDSHQDLELNLLKGERLTWLIGDKQVTLRRAQLAVFWGAVPHQRLTGAGLGALAFIHIPLPWFLSWGLPPRFVSALLTGSLLVERARARAPLDRLQFGLWQKDLASGDGARRQYALDEIRARLGRLAASAAEAGAAPEGGDRLVAAARLVAERYTEPLYAGALAREVGVSADHLAKLFRRRFGTTLPEFINRHRIWHAQRLLVTTARPVLELALESGFGSLSQFNELFRKYCRCSPREYRQTLGGGTPNASPRGARRRP